MRIGGIAAEADVNVRTLRCYERRGLLERIDERIKDLKRMRSALAKYVNACRDQTAIEACPLLSALCGEETVRG